MFKPDEFFAAEVPRKLTLQSKIVLAISSLLIVGGMVVLIFFEQLAGDGEFGFRAGFFQSVTARTAGFNSVDIEAMNPVSKLVLIVLMFIGGSPGSTAVGEAARVSH